MSSIEAQQYIAVDIIGAYKTGHSAKPFQLIIGVREGFEA